MALVPKGWIALSTCEQINETTFSGTPEFNEQVESYWSGAKDFIELFGEENVACYQFGESPKLSVYLYSIIAGPYELVKSEKPDIVNYRVPLRIFSRKSIKKYAEKAKDVYYHVTKCGIDFYEELFSTAYPFSKLDQVFIPDYNMGAMENVGCVIYRDDYI